MINQKKEKIITISSVRGAYGQPAGNYIVYATTKGGVISLIRQFAAEWAKINIQANVIAPTVITTSLSSHILANPELSKTFKSSILLGRWTYPDDLAGAIIYFESDASNFVMGQTLFVGGGATNWDQNELMTALEKKLASRYMVVTDIDLPLTEVVKRQKDMLKIARPFPTIKQFLEIRPVNHIRDDRTETHVFLCILCFLLSRIMKKAVKDEMTVAFIIGQLLEPKAIPARVPEGTTTLRSESEKTRTLLEKTKTPILKGQ